VAAASKLHAAEFVQPQNSGVKENWWVNAPLPSPGTTRTFSDPLTEPAVVIWASMTLLSAPARPFAKPAGMYQPPPPGAFEALMVKLPPALKLDAHAEEFDSKTSLSPATASEVKPTET
jgi:hypothetical protein